ncbi:hypothetical protein [Nocardia sp. NBC_01377]
MHLPRRDDLRGSSDQRVARWSGARSSGDLAQDVPETRRLVMV